MSCDGGSTSGNKKHGHRGRGKNRKLKVYYNNVNGLSCRSDSVKAILEMHKPDIVVFCETKASNSFVANFFENVSYVPVIKSRISLNSGGIVIAARSALSQHFTDSTSSLNDNICSAMLKSDHESLKIIAAYGPQETFKKEERDAFYEELNIEFESGNEQGCLPLIIGDFNAKIIKNDTGSIVALSPNGELLCTFMIDNNLIAVNHLKNCSGKWTRQNRCNIDEKSVLDYMLVHENMAENVTEVIVDEDLIFTPYNVRKVKGGELSVKYTDHNALVLQLKDVFRKSKSKAEKPVGWWKITDEGLNKFTAMTDHYDAFSYDNSKGVQDNFDCMSGQLESVMLNCFKKIYPNKNKRGPMSHSNVNLTHKILQGMAKEGKIQRKVAHHYLKLLHDKIVEIVYKRKAARIAEVAVTLTEEDKFSTNKFWQLNKSSKNKKCAKSSVISSKNTELFNDAAILKEYEREF